MARPGLELELAPRGRVNALKSFDGTGAAGGGGGAAAAAAAGERRGE
jgi:hypothetical protein